jgi:MFS family permease
LVTCLLFFTIFSGACGASQTLLQLYVYRGLLSPLLTYSRIMFRWIQGFGASGVLAVGMVYGFEARPPQNWPAYSAVISLSVAISLAVAPVIGASLTKIGQWRWIFLIKCVPLSPIERAPLILQRSDRIHCTGAVDARNANTTSARAFITRYKGRPVVSKSGKARLSWSHGAC